MFQFLRRPRLKLTARMFWLDLFCSTQSRPATMSLSRADAAVEDVDGDQLRVSRHPGDDAGDIGPVRGAVVADTVVRRRVEGLRDAARRRHRRRGARAERVPR